MLPVTTAIIVARGPDVEERLQGLFAVLIDANIVVTVVAEPEEATAQLVMADSTEVQSVLIDASDVDVDDAEAMKRLLDTIRAITAVPYVTPIVVAPSPRSDLVIRVFRAGAGDFIDLEAETHIRVTEILQHVADQYRHKIEQRDRIRGLRAMLEDFLKNLVKAERRTIDLEQQLAMHERGADMAAELDNDRPPMVLIVEDDSDVVDELLEHLDESGLYTMVATSGEQAIEGVRAMAKQAMAVDLALVDAHLPGMGGLEAIRIMREIFPQLSAMLMTGFTDPETAIGAADLGVVGYVLKPFDDMKGLIKRIKEYAMRNMASAREQHYLDQIKQRHEKILLRYRKLAADLEQL